MSVISGGSSGSAQPSTLSHGWRMATDVTHFPSSGEPSAPLVK